MVALLNPNAAYKMALTWPTCPKGSLCQMQAGLPELGHSDKCPADTTCVDWGCCGLMVAWLQVFPARGGRIALQHLPSTPEALTSAFLVLLDPYPTLGPKPLASSQESLGTHNPHAFNSHISHSICLYPSSNFYSPIALPHPNQTLAFSALKREKLPLGANKSSQILALELPRDWVLARDFRG